MSQKRSVVLVGAMFVLASCGEPAAPVDAGGTDGGPGDAGEEAVVVSSGGLRSSASPIAGVEVCVYMRDDIPCATSAADGSYTLPGVPARMTALTFEHATHLDVLSPLEDLTADIALGHLMLTDAEATAGTSLAGATEPYPFATTGVAALQIRNGAGDPIVGAAVTISPDVGNGPVYIEGGVPDLSRTTTGNGSTLFTDLPPGTYELTITHPDGVCTTDGIAWSPTAGGTVRAPIAAGHLSSVTIFCAL